MSRRTEKLGSTIARAASDTLARGLADPRLKGMITVTGAEVTEDLKRARIRVTIYPEKHEDITMHGLAAATSTLRRRIMQRIHLKEMPRVEFVIDEGIKSQMKISELLARDRAERPERYEPNEPESSPETPTP